MIKNENTGTQFSGIISRSRDLVRLSKDYETRVQALKKQVHLKYEELLCNEKRPVRRLFLKVAKIIELRKSIRGLTSLDKLYLAVK